MSDKKLLPSFIVRALEDNKFIRSALSRTDLSAANVLDLIIDRCRYKLDYAVLTKSQRRALEADLEALEHAERVIDSVGLSIVNWR